MFKLYSNLPETISQTLLTNLFRVSRHDFTYAPYVIAFHGEYYNSSSVKTIENYYLSKTPEIKNV